MPFMLNKVIKFVIEKFPLKTIIFTQYTSFGNIEVWYCTGAWVEFLTLLRAIIHVLYSYRILSGYCTLLLVAKFQLTNLVFDVPLIYYTIVFSNTGNRVLWCKNQALCWFSYYRYIADDGSSRSPTVWSAWESCHSCSWTQKELLQEGNA